MLLTPDTPRGRSRRCRTWPRSGPSAPATGGCTAAGADRPAAAFTVAGPLADLEPRLLAGRLPAAGAKEIVVSELVLYDLGFRDDADLERDRSAARCSSTSAGCGTRSRWRWPGRCWAASPGDELSAAQTAMLEKLAANCRRRLDAFDLTSTERAELKRLLEAKPDPDDEQPFESGATATGAYRVCGVVRRRRPARSARSARPLEAWELPTATRSCRRRPARSCSAGCRGSRDSAVNSADVRVRPGGDLPGTVTAIEAMGFRTHLRGEVVRQRASAR